MANTRRILAESLKNLLKIKPLEKITVTQLVDDCDINRQTFYYHFHDIYELLEYMFFVELDKIFENPIEYDNNFVYKWEKVYYTILQSALNEKRMIMSISQSIGRSKLDEILYDVFYRIILRFIRDESEGINICEEEKNFIANFYKYAFVGITLDWVDSFMKVKPEIIACRVSRLIGGDLRTALHKNR